MAQSRVSRHPPEPKSSARRPSKSPPKSSRICLHCLHLRHETAQIGGGSWVLGGGKYLTGGGRIADGRAGTPSVGPPARSKQRTVHMLSHWAARVRICRRGRSRPLTCSELARACANSPATLTGSVTRPAGVRSPETDAVMALPHHGNIVRPGGHPRVVDHPSRSGRNGP